METYLSSTGDLMFSSWRSIVLLLKSISLSFDVSELLAIITHSSIIGHDETP